MNRNRRQLRRLRQLIRAIGVLVFGQAWIIGGLWAQEPQTAGSPKIELRKPPLELAGYLGVMRIVDDSLDQHHFFTESSASLFLSKPIGRWRLHSEFNANTAPQEDAEGIHFFQGRNLSIKLDSASLQYNWRDWLQTDAGFLFVPTYWRTHRYQSTTLTVDEPLMDQNVFPTAFTGVAFWACSFHLEHAARRTIPVVIQAVPLRWFT